MPPKRTLTDAEIETITTLYQAGETVRSIAWKLSCRTDTVTAVLDQQGIPIRTGRTKFTSVQEGEILDLHNQGISTAEIARTFDVHPATISNLLTRNGVELSVGHPRGRGWSDEDRETIVRLYREGNSQQQISLTMEVSQTVVSRVLKHENEPITSRGPRDPRNHSRYKGGRIVDSNGYIKVVPTPEDEGFYIPTAGPYVYEHRLVLAHTLGRPLTEHETVHHKDGNRQNNDPSNLQLRQGKHGAGVRYVCADCGSHNVVATDF